MSCARPGAASLWHRVRFVGLGIFTSIGAQFECWILVHPERLIWLPVVVMIIGGGLVRYRRELIDLDTRLIFEELPTPAVHVLDLARGR